MKSDLYNTVFQIEQIYGMSFLLFHSALRVNNMKLAKVAKKTFSTLFHINKHPNYYVIDVHTL